MSAQADLVKKGRGGWYACHVCPGNHTETSKAGRPHRDASVWVELGPEEFKRSGMYVSAKVRRLVEETFARREAIRAASVPDVFRRWFEDEDIRP